jgi:hypothetical protein
VRGDAVKVIRARHDADGLHLHARTATAGWLGERLDVGWAIDVLHPLAARPPCRGTTVTHSAEERQALRDQGSSSTL